MFIRTSLLYGLVVFAASFIACEPREAADDSSFGLIQSRILTPTCAIPSCHASESDATFGQHRLILTKGTAYAQLVGIGSVQDQARADGLLRVKAGDSENSLLFHKLQRNAGHHGSDYGNPMPLGLDKLSSGQLEFIRQWIDAGAPRNGSVADPALLDDETPQPDFFEPLAVPENGFQVHLEPFTVTPDFEREYYVYKPVGNSSEVWVNRIETSMRENSHHLVIYDFKSGTPDALTPKADEIRDIRNENGSLNIANLGTTSFHVFMAGSQTPYADYRFPEGVALRLTAGKMLDFNPHYVNKGTLPIYGEAFINFHTTVPDGNVKEARTLNLANRDLQLPPGRTTVTKTFTFDKRIHVFSLTSHTHKLGETFIIRISGGPRNGEVVYESSDWHHPEVVGYDAPIVLEPGQGLTSVITYNNTTSRTVSFGLTSEDEMGIIFGYYHED